MGFCMVIRIQGQGSVSATGQKVRINSISGKVCAQGCPGAEFRLGGSMSNHEHVQC